VFCRELPNKVLKKISRVSSVQNPRMFFCTEVAFSEFLADSKGGGVIKNGGNSQQSAQHLIHIKNSVGSWRLRKFHLRLSA